MLWLHSPELFDFVAAPVDVELKGEFTYGMTVCDLKNAAGRPCNADVAMQVCAGDAMALFMRLLRQSLNA